MSRHEAPDLLVDGAEILGAVAPRRYHATHGDRDPAGHRRAERVSMSPPNATSPTPSRLWKLLSPEQRLRAARALWRADEAAAERTQAALHIAQQRKFRPKTVLALDDEQKARYLASIATVPDALASRLFVVYHLAEQRPMMSAFLDALGIPHEGGLIHDDAATPDPARIAAAAATIGTAYPAHDVAIYLNTLLWQDPATWGALADVPEARLG
jgi:hypothetical protein